MKKTALLALLFFTALGIQAQNTEAIKLFVVQNNFKAAKDELDKAMGNAKFAAKAEAQMLKAYIYGSLAATEGTIGTPQGETLASDAYTALKKYMELDPKLGDGFFRDGSIAVYNAYALNGYNDYEKQKWESATMKFKKAAELSDMLIGKKIINKTFDTTIVYLAGATAQNSKNIDDALGYYKRLADIKIPGADYVSMYKYIVYNSYLKKDFATFEKYKVIGRELYPTDEFFGLDKIDFAYDIAENWNDKLKAIEEVLSMEPNNYKGNLLLGELIFDTLYSTLSGAVQPANAKELETRMVDALNKAISLKPDDKTAYIDLGDHYYRKADLINDMRTKHASDMKTRTKPGAMASKDDIAKRDQLDKQYGEALDLSRNPYEKAAQIFAKMSSLDARQKQIYKNVANRLANVYEYKKIMAKGNPAEVAKWAAEEKKWNDVYETIK